MEPPEVKTDSWIKRNWQFIAWVVTMLMGILGSWFTGQHFVPIPPPQFVEIEKPVLIGGNDIGTDGHSFGWVEDRDQISANLDPVKTLHFTDTPAGKAVQGDEDVFLYRIVRKVNNRGPPWYPNINQGSVGCCVGAGSKHGCDVVQATAIASGQQFDWKPVSAEVIYGVSRIQVGGGQIRGDGSMGVWAWKGLKDVGAFVPMEKIGRYDLSEFNPARARQWGAKPGVPKEVLDIAKQHPVKGAALVTSVLDVKRALMQGYPVVVCSNVGFNDPNGSVGTRDRDGFIKARGTWPHCMCFIGWRNGARSGALCLNSWGDEAHQGPVWPDDAPKAAFWIEEATVNSMVKQGDSFALSDVQGFPARKPKPDWFIHRMNEPDRFANTQRNGNSRSKINTPESEFALTP